MSTSRVLIIDDLEDIHRNIKSIFEISREEKLDALRKKLMAKKDSTSASGWDDQKNILSVAQNRQERHEYDSLDISFDSAFQGEEGFQLVKKAIECFEPYALAIVDMRMPPGIDGLETVKKIREIDQNIQIIICSAYSDHSWDDVAETLGISDKYLFLSKPFEVSEIKQMVINLVEKWRLNRQNEKNIEQLRIARVKAEESAKSKQDLLALVGHELRTPLNTILLCIQDLVSQTQNQDIIETLNFANDSAMNLTQIVDDILLYLEIDKNFIDVNASEVKFYELIESIKNMFANRFSKKGVGFSVYLDPDLPESVIGDIEQIKLLLKQILLNAMNFTDSGQVKLKIQCDPSIVGPLQADHVGVRFEVEDTGVGMNQVQQENCFELFYQGENIENHSRTGLGLGLSLCKRLTLAFDGKISVQSQVKQGTRVSIYLPLKTSQQTKQPETAEHQRKSG